MLLIQNYLRWFLTTWVKNTEVCILIYLRLFYHGFFQRWEWTPFEYSGVVFVLLGMILVEDMNSYWNSVEAIVVAEVIKVGRGNLMVVWQGKGSPKISIIQRECKKTSLNTDILHFIRRRVPFWTAKLQCQFYFYIFLYYSTICHL